MEDTFTARYVFQLRGRVGEQQALEKLLDAGFQHVRLPVSFAQ